MTQSTRFTGGPGRDDAPAPFSAICAGFMRAPFGDKLRHLGGGALLGAFVAALPVHWMVFGIGAATGMAWSRQKGISGRFNTAVKGALATGIVAAFPASWGLAVGALGGAVLLGDRQANRAPRP